MNLRRIWEAGESLKFVPEIRDVESSMKVISKVVGAFGAAIPKLEK